MEAPRRPWWGGGVRPLVVAVLALLPALFWLGGKVRGPLRCDSVASMIRLERAGTSSAAQNLLQEWRTLSGLDEAAFRGALRAAIIWDFAFILVYTAAIVVALIAVRRAAPAWPWLAGAMPWLVGAALAAAALDAVENTALLRVVSVVPVPGGAASLARAAAWPKFVLLGLLLAFIAVMVGVLIARRVQLPPETWPVPLLMVAPLGTWALSYPLLAGVAVLVVGVAWRVLLAGLGIPDLFWHEKWWPRFAAGVGTGALAADLGIVGFLLDAPSAWVRRLAHGAGFPRIGHPAARALVRYLMLTSVPVAAAVAAATWTESPSPRFYFPFGLLAGGILYGFLAVWVWSTSLSSRVMDQLPPAIASARRERSESALASGRAEDEGRYDLDGLAVILMAFRLVLLAFLVAAAAGRGGGWTVPPAFAICLILSTIVAIYGLLVFFFPLHRFGLVAAVALAIAAAAGVGGTRHPIREMDYRLAKPPGGAATPISLADSGLADDAAVLDNWIATYGSKGPLVLVAVDGGGVRAATWTMTVLTELEAAIPGFASQVRVVTGASGGMQAAVFWVGSLQPPLGGAPPGHGASGKDLLANDLVDAVSTDSLTPLTERLVLHDLIPGFGLFGPDRGDAIAAAWVENTHGVFEATVRSLQAGEVAGWRPSLIVSPMIVEDGRRLLISNLDLDGLATEATRHRYLGRGAVEFARLFRDAAALRLGTAARMSATFPYVMPAIQLPTNPPLRMVDAGYYDEHGVNLAALWLLRHAGRLVQRNQRVVLIEVPDALASVKKRTPCIDRRSVLAQGLSGLTTPLEGILSGRDAVSAYGNDELIETVAATFAALGNEELFQSVAFEPPYGTTTCGCCARSEDEVPLSWSIRPKDRGRLRRGMAASTNHQELERLKAWWTDGTPMPPAVAAICQ